MKINLGVGCGCVCVCVYWTMTFEKIGERYLFRRFKVRECFLGISESGAVDAREAKTLV